MSHLAAFEHDGGFDLIPFFQKRQDMVALHVEVIVGSLGTKLHFLEFNGLLVLLGFVLSLAELIEKFAVINNAANRRIGRRRNLNQIQPLSARHLQGIRRGHDSQLLTFVVNHPDFFRSNPFVDACKSIGDKSSLLAHRGAPKKSRVRCWVSSERGHIRTNVAVYSAGCSPPLTTNNRPRTTDYRALKLTISQPACR